MKSLSILAIILTLGLTLSSGDAEAAKRLGSGKSAGMQRQMTPPPAKAPDAAPSASQAAPAKAPTAAPQAQAGRSWMGPLAGLAAGIGLAALASHFGFGEELASFMMMALIGLVVIAAIGFFMRKRAAASAQPALAGAAAGQGSFRQAGQHVEAETRFSPVSGSASSNGTMNASSASTANIPADFDVAGFVRNAKVNYIRLQAANDAGNLDDVREFTTPEMFAEIKLTIDERGGATQTTDVIAIDAEVLDVCEEASRYIVSVRFSGQVREDSGPTENVDEIWHLVKPRNGSSGWVLAGIQQLQ